MFSHVFVKIAFEYFVLRIYFYYEQHECFLNDFIIVDTNDNPIFELIIKNNIRFPKRGCT